MRLYKGATLDLTQSVEISSGGPGNTVNFIINNLQSLRSKLRTLVCFNVRQTIKNCFIELSSEFGNEEGTENGLQLIEIWHSGVI